MTNEISVLERKTCELWPGCACYETLKRWAYNLDDEQVWPHEVLECAETLIFISLACIERHCPDRVVKAYAGEQLQKRFWDRQKTMGIYVEQ
jgi:hypothetical protein